MLSYSLRYTVSKKINNQLHACQYSFIACHYLVVVFLVTAHCNIILLIINYLDNLICSTMNLKNLRFGEARHQVGFFRMMKETTKFIQEGTTFKEMKFMTELTIRDSSSFNSDTASPRNSLV